MRLGFLGAGKIAVHHAKAALAAEQQIVAAATETAHSSNWPAFREVATSAEHRVGIESVLGDDQIDAIVVCLPWDKIKRLVPRFAADKRPFLIEKPVTLNSETLRRLIKSLDGTLENKFVGFNRRHYDCVGRLRAKIRSQRPTMAKITICEDPKSLGKRFGPDIASYVLDYSGVHSLDLALHFLGPLSIRASYPNRLSGGRVGISSVRGLGWLSGIFDYLYVERRYGGHVYYFDDATACRLEPLECLTVVDGYRPAITESSPPVRRYEPNIIEKTQERGDLKPGLYRQMLQFCGREPSHDAARLGDALRVKRFIEEVVAAVGQRTPGKDEMRVAG